MYNYDIFSKICKYLNNKEKIYLTMMCNVTDKFKHKLIYPDNTEYKRISHLPYYDNFETITDDNPCITFPKNAKKLIFYSKYSHFYPRTFMDLGMKKETSMIKIPISVTHITLCDMLFKYGRLIIPKSVTHLKFCPQCTTAKNYIRQSITHLTLPMRLDDSIKDCIPGSVTHLKLPRYFNEPIEDLIPSSVIYLKFGDFFNQSVKDNIPKSVTHLKFGRHFRRSIKNSISDSVTHLKIPYDFDDFGEPLPATITHLQIGHGKKYNTLTQIMDGNFASINDFYFDAIKKYIPTTVKVILLIVPDSDMYNVD
uniref:Uncharacterized protein n=1 Tax=viral metagenome TaxID=1070528 RepID=A0A6C0C7T0_9ZZZZ